MHVRRLIPPLKDADKARCTELLVKAFVNEPCLPAFVDYNYDLQDASWWANVQAGLLGGEVWVAGLEPDAIDGIAIMYGPADYEAKTAEQKAARWEIFDKHVSQEGIKWFTDVWYVSVETLYKQRIGADGPERKLAGWYLHCLAAHPDAHGKGIGKALLATLKSKADEDGVESFIETALRGNVIFYGKCGYPNVGDPVIIPFKGGQGPLWVLHRPAPFPHL